MKELMGWGLVKWTVVGTGVQQCYTVRFIQQLFIFVHYVASHCSFLSLGRCTRATMLIVLSAVSVSFCFIISLNVE